MKSPLLSVIIPTKNRFYYAKQCVELLLSFKSDLLEIVVQDNSDDNEEAHKYFAGLIHPNVKYFYNQRWISVIENCDLAVLNSSGEYVCFIGDDDGLMPYVMDLVSWMKQNDIKAVKGERPNYTWPGQKSWSYGKDVGTLKLFEYNYGIERVNCKKALNNAISKGGTDIDMMPALYHGIVSRVLLNEIYELSNSHFPGPSPDMASAVAISQLLDFYYKIHIPIIIDGKSSSSTGGQGLLHKHVSRIEDVKHLPKETSSNWTKKIPQYWTGPTIWAESLVHSCRRVGNIEKLSKMNWQYLYAKLFVYNFPERKQIFSEFRLNYANVKFLYYILFIFLLRSTLFVKRFVIRKKSAHYEIVNIKEAMNIIKSRLDLNRIQIIFKEKI